MQFALIFHLLSHGCPMTKHTTMQTLFMQLNVLDNPIKLWFNGCRWEMVDCMSKQVLKQTQTIVVGASFLSLSVDEVTTIDNQSQISVHAYVMFAWKRIPILLTPKCVVKGGNVDNFTIVIVQAFMEQGG